MRKTMSFVIFVVVVLAFLFYLSQTKKAPFMPSDALHAGLTSEKACAECHGPGKNSPLLPGHPPKEQCLICHRKK